MKKRLIISISMGILMGLAPGHVVAETYIGVSLGYDNSLSGPDSVNSLGGAGSFGRQSGISYEKGNYFAITAGQKINDKYRYDVSYEHRSGDFDWFTTFPGCCTANFNAERVSKSLFANFYLHGKGFYPGTFDTIDPFIGIGVGVTRNELNKVFESPGAGGAPYAVPDSETKSNSAAKFILGAEIDISDKFKVEATFVATYLGNFYTGDRRTIIFNGSTEAIGSYDFDDTWSYTANIGLRYYFK